MAKFATVVIKCASAFISKTVYNANFLRFMERGRTNYLRLLGMNQQELLKEARRDVPGFAFVVRSMSIDFLKPAILDDLLEVITVPEDVRARRLSCCRNAGVETIF